MEHSNSPTKKGNICRFGMEVYAKENSQAAEKESIE
jgi:hypothetical protein